MTKLPDNEKRILSPEEHRALAKRLRETGGQPGGPTEAEVQQMAKQHEAIADMIEGRFKKNPPTSIGG